MIRTLLISLFLAGGAQAQQAVSPGTGAVLRALDKVSGQVQDVTLPNGTQIDLGRLTIAVAACRFPRGNPNGDAFAFMVISEVGKDAPVFQGWMIASAPALNAMDHSRYDVWVLRCTTS